MLFGKLAELVVRTFDLAEAEGRVLRVAVIDIALRTAIMLAAAVVSIGAIGFLLAAIWIGLSSQLGQAWASLVAGAVGLIVAGGAFWWATKSPVVVSINAESPSAEQASVGTAAAESSNDSHQAVR